MEKGCGEEGGAVGVRRVWHWVTGNGREMIRTKQMAERWGKSGLGLGTKRF